MSLRSETLAEITKLLKKAYEDAPKATNNPLIYNRVCPVPWNLICYDMKPLKSLANRLLNEEGWTADRMRKVSSIFKIFTAYSVGNVIFITLIR